MRLRGSSRMAAAGCLVAMMACGFVAPGTFPANAELVAKESATNKAKRQRRPAPEAKPAPAPDAPPAATAAPTMAAPPEQLEADVSTRSIAVTAAFKGSEVTVFGTVDNSRQPSPESGYYDVVVAVEGALEPAVVRRKSNVAGLWINTHEANFDLAPSYYAVASTRPLEEIADAEVLAKNGIGFENILITVNPETLKSLDAAGLRDFQAAISRLKSREGLYSRDDYGVTFSGRSLFRSTLALPANVPVGQLTARIYLFRDGVLLNRKSTKVGLERTGIERFIHESAHNSPWLYGIIAVLIAMSCGLAASALFDRVRL